MIFWELLHYIEEADIITVYRHTNPDCDAAGSQFGLKQWITDNWPDKKVYALGFDSVNQGQWPDQDTCDDETVKQSLAIILDTANAERVDDQRFKTAKHTFRVDHHPDVTPYTDMSIVLPEAAATCQILADLCAACESTHQVTRTCAQYLYAGLLTDTLNFTTSNTTADTLKAAGFLCRFGVDIPGLSRSLFDRSLNGFRFSAWVRSNCEIQADHLGYVVIPLSVQEEYHMSASKARSFVDELGHVREFEAWAVFTEKKDGETSLYDGSLRSKTVRVNDIAAMYGGGGHLNAAGVKNLSEEQMHDVLNRISDRFES